MAIKITTFPTKDDPTKCVVGEVASLASWHLLEKKITETSWSAGIFKDTKRTNANFESCEIIALDVDDGCTLTKALELFRPYKHIIYLTRNHQVIKYAGTHREQPARDRFRVVLQLDRPIYSEAEYRLTWKALRAKFPFMDRQANDPARFYFPGRAAVSLNTEGASVKVYSVLAQATSDFIRNGAPDGEWNGRLFKAAKDMQEQGYTEEQACLLLEEATKLPGNSGVLDEADLHTIRSAYSKPAKYPARETALFAPNADGEVEVDMDALAHEVFDDEFLHYSAEEVSRIYRISDQIKQEVVPCPNENLVERHAVSRLRELASNGVELPRFGRLFKHWKTHGYATQEMPPSFGWPTENNYVIKRMGFVPTEGKFPAWSQFLDRLTDAEVFMAFVWSAFELKNKSRQALWLYGPQGQDGKSTVLRVISRCFGNAAGSLNNTQISSHSRFTLSLFFNKRVTIYPDAKNTKFTMSELFRNITSGDVVPVEFKGEGTIHCELYVKLMISSNEMPEMTDSNADKSRTIILEVSPSETNDDPLWEQKLEEELPYFLHACRVAYEKLCPNNGNIQLSEEVKQLTNDSAEDYQIDLDIILNDFFVLDPEGQMRATEFQKYLRDVVKVQTNQDIKNFKQYIQNKYKIVKKRYIVEDQKQLSLYRGIKPKIQLSPMLSVINGKGIEK